MYWMMFFSRKLTLSGVHMYFVKKVPTFEIVWPAPATPSALTVKGVYKVSYSWYGYIIGGVCTY